MITVQDCAERTGARTIQVFIRANRKFADNRANAVSDYTQWKQNGIIPTYVRDYCQFIANQCPA